MKLAQEIVYFNEYMIKLEQDIETMQQELKIFQQKSMLKT